MKPPRIHTHRLILEPLSLTHVDDYQRHFVDYEVVRHLSSQVPWPYPVDGVRGYIEAILPEQGVSRWDWAVVRKSHPKEAIGSVGLFRDGTPEHRGFWLGRSFWGNGYMTEACEAVNAFAFTSLGYSHLIFSNAVGNLASRRVKEKTGAVLLGQREASFVDPQYRLAETWELTRASWQARQAGNDD